MYKYFLDDKKAVFFGLDGVVVDTIPYWEEAFQTVIKNVGIDSTLYSPAYARRGYTLQEKWETFISNKNLSPKLATSELIAQTENTFIELVNNSDLDVIDGFWELTSELKQKNLSLGLVSNSHKPIVNFLLDFVGIKDKVFDIVLTLEDVKNPKPSPDIYKLGANRLNTLPINLLSFEDSIPGAEASVKAGAKTLVIWDGSYAQHDYPDAVIYFFGDFTPLVGNMDADLDEQIKNFANSALEEQKNEPQN